jgi:CRISPR-associated protein Cas2
MPGQPQERFYVIAYDISDDRRRTKVHKVLLGFGKWTQFSLFECFLTDKQKVQMRAKLDKHLRPGSDSVRFYELCSACVAKTETIGLDPPHPDTTYIL